MLSSTEQNVLRIFTSALAVFLIISLSLISSRIWGGKPETVRTVTSLEYSKQMTIAEFGRANNIPAPLLKRIFPSAGGGELHQRLEVENLSYDELLRRTNRILAVASEYESKNWLKIPVKFSLWILFLATVFILMKRNSINRKMRIAFYVSAVVVFGVVFGPDPSPMGTVKDAIVLYGKSGAIFPPRMIALAVFLIMTLTANKFVCSWGCQFGTLQDLLFRINRNGTDTAGIIRQIKPPFILTNGVRVLFFAGICIAAFIFAFDIVEEVDPFKIFKPIMIGWIGAIFITVIVIASLFMYRPWCHLFCPFGLVSWLFEKMSRFKIVVDYDTCIACEKCTSSCPSTVMSAILKRTAFIPDCFTCGTCINACPTGSVSLSSRKRTKPPKDKFRKKSRLKA